MLFSGIKKHFLNLQETLMTTLLRTFFFTLFSVYLAAAGNSSAAVQTVSLPVTLDYPLLQSLLVNRAFPETGETVTLINELNGCVYLTMAKPKVREYGGRLQLEVEVRTQAGTPIAGNCFNPIEWYGFLVFEQQPYITKDWQLAFNTVDTKLLGPDRQPGSVSSVLWELIKPYIHNYINSLTIDLMPSVTDMKSFLMPLFPHQIQERTAAMLASMRPGPVKILPDQVHIDILAEVEEVFDPMTADKAEELTDEELEQVVALWESMDSMLSFLVTVLSQEVLTPDEQGILIDVLLDTRYRFTDGLASREIGQDFVRRQFVDAWQQLSPIFHNHLYKKKGGADLLGYLAFVSSSDALAVLDRLGPTFGLEISRNGLVRLMQMLHADPQLLDYRYGINPGLQKLFRLNQNPQNLQNPQSPQNPQNSQKPEQDGGMDLINSILDLFAPTLVYAAQQQITMEDIRPWIVPSSKHDEYINKVNAVLDVAIVKAEHQDMVPEKLTTIFHRLIEALAWQESCFRQFISKDGKLTYLLSYNNSSVGIMQVNERVWRGIYDRERLRWDIRYNSAVGCEIAAMYLTRYALRDAKAVQNMKEEDLAGLVYAMYNGGPGQVNKYGERVKRNKLYKSDKLFLEKYGYVKNNDAESLRKCLVGG